MARYDERVTERYKPGENHSVTERYLDDLCVQISVNARIAERKFAMFTIAAGCALAAIFCLTTDLVGPSPHTDVTLVQCPDVDKEIRMATGTAQ
ncbi:hypothetical protein NLM27_26970 [Bradyrhizobium sp. CCGB12]|uniref:hypothetical protein n=1 Tax=Bradyrhizobium sp. CCGB12 TaxID=2949632 RepID=UPI0020B22740|nr:hypothetical protein [Bradyrhizobium sp. CCGB12]MCP3392392.1 hypothetical protein [Bradyrhizobium sp. CCGB12]